jgi:RHS repeat-associated protein
MLPSQDFQRRAPGFSRNDVIRLYYTTDHLGSIREVVDGKGTVRARYGYTPYGERAKEAGDLDADFGYTAHYTHESSGIILAPYRGYDPITGRWLSRDPIGEKGGVNLYQYVRNAPSEAIDPLGLDTYLCNRQIGGDRVKPRWNDWSHTFAFTTNPDGTVKHTYSWGNKANSRGWNKDQPEDVSAANEALRKGYAQHFADAKIDPFVEKEFDSLNKKENEHLNLGIVRNCKFEAGNLVSTALLRGNPKEWLRRSYVEPLYGSD